MPDSTRNTDALNRVLRDENPLTQILSALRSRSPTWKQDRPTPMRAYIFACLSELAYLRISKYELEKRDGYKIIPSELLERLDAGEVEFDVASALRGVIEADVTLDDTGGFIFLTFNLPHFTVIAVRGTQPTLADWTIDLDAQKIKLDEKLGYHNGFYDESKSALPLLLTRARSSDNPLFFTGHSMGAAVASILPQIWKGPQKLMTPYAFASPRFGTEEVAKKFPVFSYVRAQDPVPHLPPELMGFRSSGWPPFMVPPTDQWQSNWQLGKAGWKTCLAAHSMHEYRHLLGQEITEDGFEADVYLELLKKRLDVLSDSKREV